jgi:AraC family transcriptional regulator
MDNTLIRSAVDVSRPSATPALATMGAIGTRQGDQRPAALVSIIRLLRNAGHALGSDKDEAHQCIEQAAALLQAELAPGELDAGASPGSTRCRLAPWQIARVTAFVDANLAEKIAIEDLATQARLSTSYFSRAFRSTVGVPPHAYVIRRRIERAQEMIRLTEKPLSEIALDCGLADQAHLSRHFRRVVGVSPGAWRRLHGGAPEITERRETAAPRDCRPSGRDQRSHPAALPPHAVAA